MSTYYAPLAGGIMIGIAAAMLLLLNGRVAGVSGILGGILARAPERTAADTAWRLAFLCGLAAAPLVYLLVAELPPAQVDAGSGTLIAAGLLVGIGTRYGSGCTSGHGVCGVSRLSPRSLVATACFMGAGFATVAVVRGLA